MSGLWDGTIRACPLSSRFPIWWPPNRNLLNFPQKRDKRRCISARRQDINEIPTALSRFWVHLFIGMDTDTVWLNRKWKIQDGGQQTSNACVFASRQGNTQDTTEIPAVKPTFLRSSIPLALMRILCDKTGSGTIQDGGLLTSSACISAPRRDINEIPTAITYVFGV